MAAMRGSSSSGAGSSSKVRLGKPRILIAAATATLLPASAPLMGTVPVGGTRGMGTGRQQLEAGCAF